MRLVKTQRFVDPAGIADAGQPRGGFNLQWAWSSGHLAGASAAAKPATAEGI